MTTFAATTAPDSPTLKPRIEYLDGLRGLAILVVVLFHAYARWPALLPYGDAYLAVPLFKYGWLGVQLFFLISGFVILMTLEKCSNARDFLYRRWLRLFPAMLICSLLIFASATLFFERPAGRPTLENLLPGLSFIEPDWWQKVLRHPVKPLEGAFWSLFVEFKFYVFAALFYFWRGRRAMLAALLMAFALSIAGRLAANYLPGTPLDLLDSIAEHLSFEHFGWFAAGAAYYVHASQKKTGWLVCATLLGLVSAAAMKDLSWGVFGAAALICLTFTASALSPLARQLLTSRPLQFLGYVSYPFYLIHENMMVSLIIKLGPLVPANWSGCLPVVVGCALAALAWALVRYAEPAVKGLITRLVRVTFMKLPRSAQGAG